MATPQSDSKRPVATAIRFPDDTHDQLREAAEEFGLSINFLVVKAVEEFLKHRIPASELQLMRYPSSAAS